MVEQASIKDALVLKGVSHTAPPMRQFAHSHNSNNNSSYMSISNIIIIIIIIIYICELPFLVATLRINCGCVW